MTRSVLRYVPWGLRLLGAHQGQPPLHYAYCGDHSCLEISTGYPTPQEAQDWALRHAGRKHGGTSEVPFRLIQEAWAVAEPRP